MRIATKAAAIVARDIGGRESITDLRCLAHEAIVQIVDRYDPARGSFETYARPRLIGAIRDGLRAFNHSRVNQDRAQAFAAGDEDGPPDPETLFIRMESRLALDGAISSLSNREATIVRGHYFGDSTVEWIGRSLGLHKSVATRAHHKAIARMALVARVFGRSSLQEAS